MVQFEEIKPLWPEVKAAVQKSWNDLDDDEKGLAVAEVVVLLPLLVRRLRAARKGQYDKATYLAVVQALAFYSARCQKKDRAAKKAKALVVDRFAPARTAARFN